MKKNRKKANTSQRTKNRLFIIISLILLLISLALMVYKAVSDNRYTSSAKAATYKPKPLKKVTYVINGQDATAGEYPFMVELYYKPLFSMKKPDLFLQHFCGGVLINKDWVLTAAHCANKYGKSNIGVAFNVLNLKDEVSNDNLRGVSKSIPHEGYSPMYNTINANDIALLKLSKSFTGVSPILLNKNDISTYLNKGTILGWGYKSLTNQTKSEILQEGDVTYSYYTDKKILTSSTSVRPYSYDSGGPLVSKYNGTFYSVGVIDQTMEVSSDSYYANVSSFIDWIQKNTGLTF